MAFMSVVSSLIAAEGVTITAVVLAVAQRWLAYAQEHGRTDRLLISRPRRAVCVFVVPARAARRRAARGGGTGVAVIPAVLGCAPCLYPLKLTPPRRLAVPSWRRSAAP